MSLIFGHFRVNLWTNEKVPCGSLYNHVVDRTMMWQDDVVGDVKGDVVSGCGPMVGFHVAQSWAATWQWENAQ
jgi:hypothetical protein